LFQEINWMCWAHEKSLPKMPLLFYSFLGRGSIIFLKYTRMICETPVGGKASMRPRSASARGGSLAAHGKRVYFICGNRKSKLFVALFSTRHLMVGDILRPYGTSMPKAVEHQLNAIYSVIYHRSHNNKESFKNPDAFANVTPP